MEPLIADLHMHTLVSGHAYGTIREMAAEAAQNHLQLIGITEHGPGVPGACDPIYYLNLRIAPRQLHGVEILYGCEVNICTGGTLSMGRRYLDALDYAMLILRCALSLIPTTAAIPWITLPWYRVQRNMVWRWKSITAPCAPQVSGQAATRTIAKCSRFVWNLTFRS